MASELVTVESLKLLLGETTSARDTLLEGVIDGVQAQFEAACGRLDRPFVGARNARTEVLDGNGMAELLLDYPIRALTSVKIGADPEIPDEELDVDDKLVLRFIAGRARLMRVDGGVFGCREDPAVVHVTYDAGADLPAAAAAAVSSGCRVILNRLGSEGAAAERSGSYSIDYASFATTEMANDDLWKIGVQTCRDRLV